MASTFRKGDRVIVIDSGDFPGTEGKTGVCLDDGSKAAGLIAVKGIHSRASELIKGYPGYTAEQLRRA